MAQYQFADEQEHKLFNNACLQRGVLFDRPNFITVPFGEKELELARIAIEFGLFTVAESRNK